MTDYTKNDKYIPMNECKKGFLYRIESRNLDLGVYDGKGGFIGIRNKFGVRSLFTEDHWDTGEPFGTVKPIKELVSVPQFIAIEEHHGIYDHKTGKEVYFVKSSSSEGGRWVFADTDLPPEEGQRIIPYGEENKDLFEWLDMQK